MLSRRQWIMGWGLATLAPGVQAQGFDHEHADWSGLLRQHVVLLRQGQASQVRYAGFLAHRAVLARYLQRLSSVSRGSFDAFTQAQQKAFLINAYNAFTIELVLTRYPDLQSIKDLGRLWSSPWKPRWIPLLGEVVSLDDIEHGMLRQRGVYDDPRIHFAVNCASIGCPMLREEAYVAQRLEQQLDQQTQRFMADRTRNRWSPASARLELSRIFDWYAEDFRLGYRGIDSIHGFVAAHANVLADSDADRARLRLSRVEIGYLDYDWSLNDAGASS